MEAFMAKLKEAGASDAFVVAMGEKLNGFADGFATHLIDLINKKEIGVTNDLRDYLYPRAVMFRDGNAKAGVKFNVYGIFVDKGVGKGQTVTEKQIGRGLTSSRKGQSTRQPKTWLTEGTHDYGVKLSELLEGDGAEILERVIAAELEKGHKEVRVEL